MANVIVIARKDINMGIVYANLAAIAAGTGLVSTDTGTWLFVGDLTDMSVEVAGISGDSITLHGSNAEDQPATGTDAAPLGGAITTDQIMNINNPIRWIKMKMTYSAGTVFAHLIGHVRGY